MSRIYKYPLQINDAIAVELPAGSVPLCVQMQGDTPCLWATVDPDTERTEQRVFRIAGTGHDLGAVGRYLNTFQMFGGGLVFHVFEMS